MLRRILAAIVVLVVTATLVVLAWPQLFSLQSSPLIAQAVSLRGLTVAVAVVVAVLLGFLASIGRRFRRLGSSLAALFLVFALVNVIVLAGRGFGNSAPATTTASGQLTVLSWNTLGGAPGAEAIAKLALDSGADIVTLPETTETTASAVANLMNAGGHPMAVHTAAFDHISKAKSTSLLTSVDLGGYHIDTSRGSTSTLPSVIALPDDGVGPTIIAVHPVAPIPNELANWRSDLAWLSTACSGKNVIMAGDFNSTLDHMVGLAAGPGKTLGDCTDAASETETAAVGTWPTFLPPLLGAPIDHVMVTANWKATGMRVVESLDSAGSDHRPIVVRLQRSR
ncbi:MAG: endonuclease/exonuclease/phosphatase family protein [Microbacteriaceae bacterium]|nr:endonuclease/exonuclease/phosphatase family protein [Microbacteriaceae bacterium]